MELPRLQLANTQQVQGTCLIGTSLCLKLEQKCSFPNSHFLKRSSGIDGKTSDCLSRICLHQWFSRWTKSLPRGDLMSFGDNFVTYQIRGAI